MKALRSAAIAAVLLLSAGGCGSSSSTSGSAVSSAVASGAGTGAAVTFTVANYMFPPLTVAPGATVRAVDGDGEAHTVTFDDGSFTTVTFDSTHPVTFTAPTAPGSYAIHCKVHPSMHGTIVVHQP